ncbi:spore germination protein GerW family protein [Salinigranum salinum]|uniref:spore germination protein GerW family protein n=1 Tax=Salinigranum salinum TaxID=1364937 RepID=UPI0012604680|nr:spore germination protein GerW family protein [Salinigranum salinum]
MSVRERLSSVLERIREHSGVTAAYGDPIERDGRTVVPVARVVYGFGGGYGPSPAERTDGEGHEPTGGDGTGNAERNEDREEGGGAEGGGMGGGVWTVPIGVVEITDDETRFVPFHARARLFVVAGASLAVGYLLGRKWR